MSDPASELPVTIAGTGSYLPEKVLTNADLELMVETSDDWITSRTGIKERRIAAEGEHTSHLATNAARKALEQANLDPADLKLIIVATITPDTLTPATACYVQQNLGAFNAAAFDISAACSGFLFAMKIAKRLISSGAFENALIVGAEKLSSFVNWTDRSTAVLFGDGAGAAILTRGEEGGGKILATEIGTDGGQTHLLNIPGGGSACPITIENADQHLATLAMLGKEVFKHAVTRMRDSANQVIERSGLKAEDIKLVIPHQANGRIIESAARRLGVDSERVFVNIGQLGNTAAASIPMAISYAVFCLKKKTDDVVALTTFGRAAPWRSPVLQPPHPTHPVATH